LGGKEQERALSGIVRIADEPRKAIGIDASV
jgi:hypothetical protein